jgi:hypothetical protein
VRGDGAASGRAEQARTGRGHLLEMCGIPSSREARAASAVTRARSSDHESVEPGAFARVHHRAVSGDRVGWRGLARWCGCDCCAGYDAGWPLVRVRQDRCGCVMTQKRSRLPGGMPGASSARGTSHGHVAPAPMRIRVLSLLLRPTAPPLALGLVVRNSSSSRPDARRRITGSLPWPTSYTVQGRRNPLKESYLRSLDINTIWLDSCNGLPNSR